MILRYLKLSFSIEPEDQIFLPSYKGSALRGGFGTVFKKAICVLKNERCSSCILKNECAYSYIFETAPPRGTELIAMEKYETIPKPFIIEPPKEEKREYNKNEKISFNLLLIGKAINYLPYFIIAFELLGRIGLGKGKGKFRLIEICSKQSKIYSEENKILKLIEPDTVEIPENLINENQVNEEGDIVLNFNTPTRIRYQRDLVVILEFHILIRNILRRLWLLSFFHGEMVEPKWDHRKIINAAKQVEIKKNLLRWYDWERYSGRQKTRMKMGGLLGKIVYSGRISQFLPLLRAGAVFHVGKGTSFGLGEYTILDNMARKASIFGEADL